MFVEGTGNINAMVGEKRTDELVDRGEVPRRNKNSKRLVNACAIQGLF